MPSWRDQGLPHTGLAIVVSAYLTITAMVVGMVPILILYWRLGWLPLWACLLLGWLFALLYISLALRRLPTVTLLELSSANAAVRAVTWPIIAIAKLVALVVAIGWRALTDE